MAVFGSSGTTGWQKPRGVKTRSQSTLVLTFGSAGIIVVACCHQAGHLFAVPSLWTRGAGFSGVSSSPQFSGYNRDPQLDGSSHSTAYLDASPQPRTGGTSEVPWAGLASPVALMVFAAISCRDDAVVCSAFGGARTDGSRLPLRESNPGTIHPVTRSPPIKPISPTTAGAGLLGVGFLLWYASNVGFNIVNKQALGLFPHAWTVSVVQLSTVVGCSALGWVTGVLPSPFNSMGKGFLWRLLPAALCHALGNGLTSVAFSWATVSFTHVVKTSEPVWMALGNLALNGNTLPRPQLLALIPVMLGVALASAGELSFTWVGFMAALGSTICFAGRGLFSKRLMSGDGSSGPGMSPLNVYALDSLLALVFTIPVALVMDGPSLLSGPGSLLGSQIGFLLAATGLSYYAYNAIAFKLLKQLDVVSHAVGNLGKRIFVIGFSVVAFHTPLTWRAAVGALTAIIGSGVYSYLKATGGKTSTGNKTDSVKNQRINVVKLNNLQHPSTTDSAGSAV